MGKIKLQKAFWEFGNLNNSNKTVSPSPNKSVQLSSPASRKGQENRARQSVELKLFYLNIIAGTNPNFGGDGGWFSLAVSLCQPPFKQFMKNRLPNPPQTLNCGF